MQYSLGLLHDIFPWLYDIYTIFLLVCSVQTLAVDIFSFGCVMYYVLTSGKHPFDDRDLLDKLRSLNREGNIVKEKYSLDELTRAGISK